MSARVRDTGGTERRERVPTEARSADDRSLPELVRELADEGSDLVRQEIALAKAEMREKVDTFTDAMGSMAVGGALLLGAMLALLWAVNRGLTSLLSQFMDVEVAVWLSPLMVAVLLGLIGLSMVKGGQKKIKEEGVTPHQTTDSLRENKRWAQAKAREVKEEAKHG